MRQQVRCVPQLVDVSEVICDSGAVFFFPTVEIGVLMGNYVVFRVVLRYDSEHTVGPQGSSGASI